MTPPHREFPGSTPRSFKKAQLEELAHVDECAADLARAETRLFLPQIVE
jgi:hypothetical protein